MISKRNFKHDCDQCISLGELNGRDMTFDHKTWDLYYCDQGGAPTVIARYGNSGHEYLSGLEFARHGTIKPLVEAEKRAREKGLKTF